MAPMKTVVLANCMLFIMAHQATEKRSRGNAWRQLLAPGAALPRYELLAMLNIELPGWMIMLSGYPRSLLMNDLAL